MRSLVSALIAWMQAWAIIENSRQDHAPESTGDKVLDALQSMNTAILRRSMRPEKQDADA